MLDVVGLWRPLDADSPFWFEPREAELPGEFTSALAMRDRVRLALEPDHIGVWPGAAKAGNGAGDGSAPAAASPEKENANG